MASSSGTDHRRLSKFPQHRRSLQLWLINTDPVLMSLCVVDVWREPGRIRPMVRGEFVGDCGVRCTLRSCALGIVGVYTGDKGLGRRAATAR